MIKAKEVEIANEVKRSDGWWHFAWGDVFVENLLIPLVHDFGQQVADEDVQTRARDEPGVPGKPTQVVRNGLVDDDHNVLMIVVVKSL